MKSSMPRVAGPLRAPRRDISRKEFQMTVETVAIDTLSPDPENARRHGAKNLDAIVKSLRRFGQQKPIVVDSQGVVRAGNGQFAAAKILGWSHIGVVHS